MSAWGATKAKRVFAALLRLGWAVKRQSGSHVTLARVGWPDYVWAFHDGDEIGPRMLPHFRSVHSTTRRYADKRVRFGAGSRR